MVLVTEVVVISAAVDTVALAIVLYGSIHQCTTYIFPFAVVNAVAETPGLRVQTPSIAVGNRYSIRCKSLIIV